MCDYCGRGIDNDYLIHANLDGGVFGSVEVFTIIDSITKEYAREENEHLSDYHNTLQLGISCGDEETLGKEIKINYCPICGRKLNEN